MRAYSLLELMLVVVIIGILASVAAIRYAGAIEKGRAAEAYSVLSDITGAERVYFVENNGYTANIAGLHNFDAVPSSDNFNFSVPSTGSSNGYAQAARKSSSGGRLSYGMCLSSGKRGSCDADDASCLDCP